MKLAYFFRLPRDTLYHKDTDIDTVDNIDDEPPDHAHYIITEVTNGTSWAYFDENENALDQNTNRVTHKNTKETRVSAGGVRQEAQPEPEDVCRGKVVPCCKAARSVCILTAVTAVYVYMGGILFSEIEKAYITQIRDNTFSFTEQHKRRLSSLLAYKGSDPSEIFKKSLSVYTDGIKEYINDYGWDGETPGAPIDNWSLPSTILYCIVVISTIGYGDTCPKSQNGRLLTVIYALMGIPLMYLFITSIGNKLGYAFKWLYYEMACKEKREKAKKAKYDAEHADDDEIHEEEEVHKTKKQNIEEQLIPVSISLSVLLLYLIGGAGLFANYEASWNLQEGFYFCFISLTSIGFGDYVFGKCFEEQAGSGCEPGVQYSKLLASCIYIIFGLGVVSMSLNNLADTIKVNFTSFAYKMGCKKKPESEIRQEELKKQSEKQVVLF